MNTPVYEMTPEDYDEVFRGKWQSAGGSIQSLQFAFEASYYLLKMKEVLTLRAWEVVCNGDDMRIKTEPIVLHDYGCALGDGTALLQALFPMATLVGFDHSSEAIRKAKERWPTLEFRVGDITKPQERADIIWTSHTLEHVRDAAKTINNLRMWCRALLVLVPPIGDGAPEGGHTDAEPFTEWIKRVPRPEFVQDFYTVRLDPFASEAKGHRVMLPELSRLLGWKGLL